MTAGKPKQKRYERDGFDTFSRVNDFTAFTLIIRATPSTLGSSICHRKTKQNKKDH